MTSTTTTKCQYLRDAHGRHLGQVIVERCEDRLCFGKFTPGTDYQVVADLFRAFEEAADNQALGVIDRIDAAITALGLRLGLADGLPDTPIHDVQIWTDGGITFRVRAETPFVARNGTVASAPSQQTFP